MVPSYVHSEPEQIDLMRRAGLLVEGVYHVLQSALPGFISPKITESLALDAPFVSGYLARAVTLDDR